MRNSHAVALAFGLIFAVGCDKAKDGAAKAGDKAKAAAGDKAKAAGGKLAKAAGDVAKPGATGVAMLAAVPGDTPYVIANVVAMPEAFMSKIGTAMEPIFKKLDAEMAREKASLGDSPQDKIGKAIIEEFEGNLNRKGLEKLGIDPGVKFVIYGYGLLPAFRVALKDPAALRAAVTRVETKSGQKAPTAKLGDVEYWTFKDDGMTFALAIIGDELVGGVTPDATAAKVLPLLFGQQKPETTAAPALAAVAARHGFKYMHGYANAVTIAKTVLGSQVGLNAEVFAALTAGDAPQMPAECKTEITAMVSNFPRMVFGYDSVSASKVSARYVVETVPALAAELKGLTTTVPGLGQSSGGLMAFGAGIDLKKTLEFAKAKTGAMKANPYKCPMLSDFNEGVNDIAMGLNQPMPPAFMGIRGFNVVIKDGKMGPGGPANIRATAIIAAEKADEIFAMAKGMVPPLASLNVAADGKPVALPAGIVPPVVEAPHVALTKDGIAVSVGVGEEKGLTALLASKGVAGPVLAFAYDMKKFMDIFAGQMGGMGGEEKELFDAITGLLGYTSYSLSFGAQGIEIAQTVTLN